MVYTKEKFKELWEANSCGSGITYDDIADCAQAWGISSNPRTHLVDEVTYKVLKAAQTNDAEEYNPKSTADMTLPEIEIKAVPNGGFIATDSYGNAKVCKTHSDLEEVIDNWAFAANLRDEPTDALALVVGDPVGEIDELINSLKVR